jgi:hypothetical protein
LWLLAALTAGLPAAALLVRTGETSGTEAPILSRLAPGAPVGGMRETRIDGEGGRRKWLEWFLGQRMAPLRTLPRDAVGKALKQARERNADLGLRLQRSQRGAAIETVSLWLALGPSTIPNGQTDGTPLSPVSGRVSAIAVHPTNPDIVYAGGALGGIWKTTNATAATPTWTPLTDTQASLSTGTIVIDPVNPNIIYVGTGELADYFGRGILRSIDGGTTWTQLAGGGDPATATTPFDGRAVTKLIIDPGTAGSTTTTTLWASTSAGYIDTPAGLIAPVNPILGGVYRSTDSGQTWTALDVPTGASQSSQVFDLALDPTDSNVLYAGVDSFPTAVNGGIWKSANAKAASPTFTHLSTGLPNPATAVPTLEEITFGIGGTSAHNTIYAALAHQQSNLWGFFKSTDGGATWTHLAAASGSGTISSNLLTVASPTFPTDGSWEGRRIIFNNKYSGTIGSVLSSTQLTLADLSGSGTFSWSVAAYPPYCDGQCFFDMTVGVDPSDSTASTVYVGGNGARLYSNSGTPTIFSHSWRSDNGGTLWTPISPGNGTTGGLHADEHAIAFDVTAGTFPRPIYDGNDGGIWSSTNQGASWKTLNTNIAITQFQSVALHPSDTRIAIGGTQDNGTDLLSPLVQTPPAWFHSDDGDGGFTVVDQSNPARMFHTYFNESNNFFGPSISAVGGTAGPNEWTFVGGDTGTGDSNGFTLSDPVSFYAPMARHPAFSPNVIYFGTNKLYRSANPQPPGGFVSSWTLKSGVLASSVLTTIGPLPTLVAGKEVVYVGSDTGQINVSAGVDGSGSLATFTRIDTSSAIMPARYVTQILADPLDATGNTAYVTYSGFNANTLATPGHVFKTTNGLNATPAWSNISGDLPDVPVNGVALDPSRSPSVIYVATDIGVFQSVNGGTHYSYLNNGLPVVAVLGIERNAHTGQIVAATHGRGMFQLVRNLLTDTTPPTCGGSAASNTVFNGTAGDSAAGDTGVATIVLQPGATNLVISSIAYSNPGSATWSVTTVDPCLPGTGTVRVSDYAGNTCDTVVGLTGNAPSAAITAPGSVPALSTGNAASVPDAGPGASYTWGITNGTITGGAGTRSITFTAGASGSVGLTVTVQNAGGCSSGNSMGVPITQVARSFVSAKTGNDANNCAPSSPCRTFTRALSPVEPGGEVVVLDSGGYGPFTITQAVAIAVPQGVYAGITASSGDAITISAGTSDVVTLKGLTINSLGGTNGIRFSTGGALVVERCTISGFSDGIRAEGPGDLTVRDTRLRNATSAAVHLLPSAPSHAALFGCRLEDNAAGLSVTATASASVEESVSSGNAAAGVSCAAGDVTIDDCLLTGNGTGASASGTGTIRIADSCVTDNTTGLAQSGGGTLLSRTSNTVEGNGTNTSGTVGSYSPK